MNLQEKIKEAKDSGYTSSEILDHLSSDSTLAPKIKEARDSGYDDDEIAGFVSSMEFKPQETKRGSLLQRIEQSAPIQKAAQYASGAIEGVSQALTLPFDIARMAGSAAGIPKKYLPYGSEAATTALRTTGVTQPPDEDSRFGRRVAQEVGAVTAFGTPSLIRSGATVAPQAFRSLVRPALFSGTGAAIAREVAPDSPLAEFGGQLIGGSIPAVGAMAVRGLLRGGPSNVPRMQERIALFRESGTSPTVGQATGNIRTQGMEAIIGKAPGGVGPIQQKAEELQRSLGQRLNQITSNIAPKDISRAGTKLQTGLKDWVDDFSKKWVVLDNQLSSKIDPNTMVPIGNTKAVLSKYAGKIKTTSAAKYLEWIENNSINGVIPYSKLREFRTEVGMNIGAPQLASDVPRGAWKDIYKTITGDVRKLVLARGDKEAIRLFDRSNKFYTTKMDVLDRFIEKTAMAAAPEQAAKDVFRAAMESPVRLAAIKKAAGDKFKGSLSFTVDKLGKATPGQQDISGDLFSANNYLTNYSKMPAASKDILFGKNTPLRRNTEVLAKVSDIIKQSGKVYANPSGTAPAAGSIGTTGMATGGAVAGKWDLVASVLGVVAINSRLAKKFTDPDFVGWLAQTTRIRPDRWPVHLQKLRTLANEESSEESKQALISLYDELKELNAE